MSTRPASRRRLAALGIDVWVRRGPRDTDVRDAAGPADADRTDGPTSTAAAPGPRIRLGSGRGRWLLVLDEAGQPQHEPLIDDLRALLGAEQVRFGRWSDSAESGVSAQDWAERGIDWVLDFGGRPVEHPAVLHLPTLDELMRSGDARRALWQALRPLLAER